jgi:hypothetical protein
MSRFVPRVAGAACALWIAIAQPASPASVSEYDVKAAYLYNFSKFVEWPQGTFSGPEEPIKVCIVGSTPLAALFKEAVKGKTANGRGFLVLELASFPQAVSCNINFISSSAADRVDELLRSVGGHPVLTVSDDEYFAVRGGIIGLTTDQHKVRFEVNMVAARRAGLKLSSQLLKVAAWVIDETSLERER